MLYENTIAATATSSANGSISVIRVSGNEAFAAVSNIFCDGKGKRIDLSKYETHTIHYGFICDESNRLIDEVLVLLMKAPRSYTREDVIEIHCHGGHYICEEILQLLLKGGVRIAEAGEFTKRAFLNGRLDLSQAESVMDIIQSKSKLSLQNSLQQLRGKIKEKIIALREMILEDVAYLEAALDDPEHISLDDFTERIESHVDYLLTEVNHLIENSNNGRLIKDGIHTVIVGKPNVGKSSLLNCMLRENRAIVTNVPGTTRDTLEEDIRIGSHLLRLIDTAGIRQAENEVESIGIAKSKESMEQADFVICVLNQNESLSEEDREVLSLIADKDGVILLNKNDLPAALQKEEIVQYSNKRVIPFSAKRGEGLDELEDYLNQLLSDKKMDSKEEIYITNVRQREALLRTKESLEKVEESIQAGMPEDMYAIDLTDAYESLGLIIGETVEEDIIEKIFKDFCMGK